MGVGITREEYEEEQAEAQATTILRLRLQKSLTSEAKWLHISGVIGGAYMAYEAGADPARVVETIWREHQALLNGSSK